MRPSKRRRFGGWCELPDDDTLTDPDVLRAALQHPYVANAY